MRGAGRLVNADLHLVVLRALTAGVITNRNGTNDRSLSALASMSQCRIRPLVVRLLPLMSSECPKAPSLASLVTASKPALSLSTPSAVCSRFASSTSNCSLSNGMEPMSRAYSNAPPEPEVIFSVETDDEFTEKVINSPVPVLVDFYADWCGPCKMLGPRIEAKVTGRNGEVTLAKVNVDYAGDLAMEYQVRAVPTVLAFKDGELVGRFEGDHGDDHLEQFIEDLVRS